MTAIGAAVGVVIDELVGEPPYPRHPVALFGSAMTRIERLTYADSRLAGVVHLSLGVGLALAVGRLATRLVGRNVATAAAVAVCAAGRMLDTEALAVRDLLRARRLPEARLRVRSLVGRDTGQLGDEELCRAVIESVAENLVDAVIAPLWWGAVAGPAGALAHRAVNTLDAMVGHRNRRYLRFGWAAARADDLANFVPARLAALAVAASHPERAGAVQRVVRRDAPRHPSPNGGVIEAAFAAALGITLGGANRYGDVLEDRGVLGEGGAPSMDDIERAVRLRRRVSRAVALAAMTAGALSSYRRRNR